MRFRAACIALSAMIPAAASADGLDLFYMPLATLGDDEVAAKGDGFGARFEAGLDTVLVHVEYSTADYSIIDDGIDQLRGGLGLVAGDNASLHAEYLKLDVFGENVDGFGAHLQLGRPGRERAGGYLRLGYLKLEDDFGSELDGFEYTVGARLPMGSVQGLLEFRSTRLEDQDGFEFFLDDLHFGVTVPFGD
jgi:hypothetical protein